MKDKSFLFVSATSGIFNLAGLGLLGVTLLNNETSESNSLKIIVAIMLICIGSGIGLGYLAEKYGFLPSQKVRIQRRTENTALINPTDIVTASI